MTAEREILVPDIGDFKDVEVIEILVKPGDAIRMETPLITIESDKAAMAQDIADAPAPVASRPAPAPREDRRPVAATRVPPAGLPQGAERYQHVINKLAFLFPGQGSQYTGMGRDLYERHPEVRALFEAASEITAMNMTDLCFNGPDEVLKRTENAQPAVCLVNAACLCVLKQEGIAPHALAGHSLGEYTALYAAGAMAFGTMMDLVRKRAIFMQEAAAKNPGGMVAVIGLKAEKVTTICKEALAAGYVAPANFNSPLQTILTGEASGIERAVELLKKAGA
ncbi:MAG: acyltransferase domain-containing protein, partial [Gammaproteobacteria bacterium]